ncbi:hypothetical protein CYMTET_26298, partial [Cymbomonas tetramitiformis]
VSIENARLYNMTHSSLQVAVQNQLDNNVSLLTHEQPAVKFISEEHSLEQTLLDRLMPAMQLIQADCCHIWVLDVNHHNMRSRFRSNITQGTYKEEDTGEQVYPLETGLVGHVAVTGNSMLVSNAADHPQMDSRLDVLPDSNATSLIILPICVKRDILDEGVVSQSAAVAASSLLHKSVLARASFKKWYTPEELCEEDEEHDKKARRKAPRRRSEPFGADMKIIAVVQIMNRNANAFTTKDLKVIESLCVAASASVRTSFMFMRLMKNAKHSMLRRNELLHIPARVVCAHLDLDVRPPPPAQVVLPFPVGVL